MEQTPPKSRCEQFLRQSIELRREEPCCRVRDVEVGAWLVSRVQQSGVRTAVSVSLRDG